MRACLKGGSANGTILENVSGNKEIRVPVMPDKYMARELRADTPFEMEWAGGIPRVKRPPLQIETYVLQGADDTGVLVYVKKSGE